jgi:hypothetical protein
MQRHSKPAHVSRTLSSLRVFLCARLAAGLHERGWRAVLVAMPMSLAACGGGGGGGGSDTSWLYPLWVPADVLVADVDGDRRNDIITLAQYSSNASQREGRLIVHRQTGPGVFAPAESYVVGVYPWSLASGDLDGDGHIDLVVADVDGGAAYVLQQDPANRGRFLAPRQVASAPSPYGVAVADLNGDTAPDICVASDVHASRRLVLVYQDPAQRGSFQPAVDLALPGSSTAVAAGDIDGDGRADLLIGIASRTGGNPPNVVLGISLQRADGSLAPVTTLAPQTGLNVKRLAVADYDGDGRNDLFAYLTPYSSDYRANLTVVLQGPVPGTFGVAANTSLSGVQGIDDAVFADLNGDDRPDAAVVGFFPVGSPSTTQSRLSLFTQSGNGAFAITSSRDLSIPASRVAAGGIDQDSHDELVVLASEDRYQIVKP